MKSSIFLQKIIFFIFVALSTLLLCFIGVYAINESMKIKIQGYFSPDLFCKIEYSVDNSSFITIFDNNYNSFAINNDYVSYGPNKTIKLRTALTGNVTTTMYLKLTNYSPTKNIRLVASDFTTINPLTYYSNKEVWCPSYANNVATISSSMPLSFSTSSGTTNIGFSLKVEEVFSVNFVNCSNVTNTTSYVPLNSNLNLNLKPNQGSYLPSSIEVKVSGQTLLSENYTYNNTTGALSINAINITGDISVNCNANHVYTIEKYANANTLTNGQVSPARYQYYVQLGNYPQTIVNSTLSATLNTKLSNSQLTLAQVSGVNADYNQSLYDQENVYSSKTIRWYNYDNKVYALSPSYGFSDSDSCSKFSDNSTNIPISTSSNLWFEVKPIYWTVIGAVNTNGTTKALSELYYREDTKMFYTDALMGKEFTGGLLLFSELVLDTLKFNDNYSYFNSGTVLYNFLNSTAAETRGNFAFYSGIGQYFSTSASPLSNYIKSCSLNTYGHNGTTLANYVNNANIFVLGGHTNTSITNQTFNYRDYFKNDSAVKTNVGIASASDYSLAHFVATTTTSTYQKSWTSNNSTIGNVCSYWLCGGTSTNTQTLINYSCSSTSSAVDLPIYGIRPALVLNLGV